MRWFCRKKLELPPPLPERPLDWCDSLIAAFREKADHNKREAHACFLLVIVATLTTPLFVTLGEGAFLAKVVPSVLSALAAAATAWLQLRKPQQLWALYREAQRELEDMRGKRHYQLKPYDNKDTADSVLADRVAALAIEVHRRWVPLVPSAEGLDRHKLAPRIEEGNDGN